MSVYLVSAVKRERRRLAQLQEAAIAEDVPASVVQLIASADQDLADAAAALLHQLERLA